MGDFYDSRMYAPGCKSSSNYARGTMRLYRGNTYVDSVSFTDQMGFGFIRQQNLAAGSYKITFQASWSTIDVKDYTISIYAKDKI